MMDTKFPFSGSNRSDFWIQATSKIKSHFNTSNSTVTFCIYGRAVELFRDFLSSSSVRAVPSSCFYKINISHFFITLHWIGWNKNSETRWRHLGEITAQGTLPCVNEELQDFDTSDEVCGESTPPSQLVLPLCWFCFHPPSSFNTVRLIVQLMNSPAVGVFQMLTGALYIQHISDVLDVNSQVDLFVLIQRHLFTCCDFMRPVCVF